MQEASSTEEPQDSAEKTQAVKPKQKRSVLILRHPKQLMGIVGYLLLAASSFMAVIILTDRNFRSDRVSSPPVGGSEFIWFVQNYSDKILALVLIIFFSIVGLQLLGAAGKTAPRVIPDEDRDLLEPLVREANKEAINQYVILSSLSGFTGTFQKIGFSGLPLATATLTLLFCGLSFAKPEFIEFAKLTLGAFIGSFVQRSSDTERLRQVVRNEDVEKSI
jgi:hypothetical protein